MLSKNKQQNKNYTKKCLCKCMYATLKLKTNLLNLY